MTDGEALHKLDAAARLIDDVRYAEECHALVKAELDEAYDAVTSAERFISEPDEPEMDCA